MSKYLDNDGLLYLWQKLKALFALKSDVGHKHAAADVTSGTFDTARIPDLPTSKITSGTFDPARIPIASASALGGVKVGANLSIDTSGVLSATDTTYSAATTSAAGLMSAADKEKLDGIADSANNYSLPTASDTTKGGVKIGSGLTMTGEVLSANVQSTNDFTTAEKTKLAGIAENANNYSLPTASSSAKGGVKIGSGLTMTGEVLSADVQSVDEMTGATSSADGTSGLVPAPESGDQNKFLRGDGTWAEDKLVAVTKSSSASSFPLLAASAIHSSITSGESLSSFVPSTAANVPTITPSTGVLAAKTFSGSGGSLTNLNGSNISTGTVAAARIADLSASKITSGTFNAARLPSATQSTQGAMSAEDKTKLDGFSAASNYALKTDITSMYKHKGSVATTNDLPASNNTEGDVYNVTATGMNYVWVVTNGTGSWDALGEIFTIESITNAEIDTILAA